VFVGRRTSTHADVARRCTACSCFQKGPEKRARALAVLARSLSSAEERLCRYRRCVIAMPRSSVGLLNGEEDPIRANLLASARAVRRSAVAGPAGRAVGIVKRPRRLAEQMHGSAGQSVFSSGPDRGHLARSGESRRPASWRRGSLRRGACWLPATAATRPSVGDRRGSSPLLDGPGRTLPARPVGGPGQEIWLQWCAFV